MPNGDPDFGENILPELEAFFSRLAPLLERFAHAHNMKIEKYYHDSHTWSLQFRHPKKGIAKIDVAKTPDSRVRIWACWWHDDYEKATRSIKRLETEPMDVDDHVLEQSLDSVLTIVASWAFDSWDSVHHGYENTWHKTWTKRQFAALDLDYPELKK